MATALIILMGLLGLAGIISWVLAARLSYRIERQRDPTLPKIRLAYTNIFKSAFWTTADDKADPATRKQLRIYMYVALGCILVLGVVSFVLPLIASEAPADAEQGAAPPAYPTGMTLSYIRSNQDGTRPERIVMHVVSPAEVHVAKMAAPCTDAAYVTAIFDPATQEAMRLVGGRLTREGGQAPQAFLTFAPDTRKLDVRVGDPASDPVETHDAPPAPWRIYDFDFGEFAVMGPRKPEDFSYGVALAWPDGSSPLLRILGGAHADFLYTSSSEKGARNHYRVTGPAFTDPVTGHRGGELITDARYGHVVEARLGRPNHPGYANFMLKLVDATPAPEGEAAWRAALAAHWANCPPENAGN